MTDETLLKAVDDLASIAMAFMVHKASSEELALAKLTLKDRLSALEAQVEGARVALLYARSRLPENDHSVVNHVLSQLNKEA